MTITPAELQLMTANDLRQVLVKVRDDLRNAVIKLTSSIGHDAASYGWKAKFAKVVRQAEQLADIGKGCRATVEVLTEPLLTDDCFRIKGRRKNMRKPERSTDCRDRRCAQVRCTRGKACTRNARWSVRRIV